MKIWYPENTSAADQGSTTSDDKPAPGKTATGVRVGADKIPSDALGKCNDGTYVSTGKKDTACSAHGGMKIWYPDGPTPQ